jgi:hypothetical protein
LPSLLLLPLLLAADEDVVAEGEDVFFSPPRLNPSLDDVPAAVVVADVDASAVVVAVADVVLVLVALLVSVAPVGGIGAVASVAGGGTYGVRGAKNGSGSKPRNGQSTYFITHTRSISMMG